MKENLTPFEEKLYDRLFVFASEVLQLTTSDADWTKLLEQILKKYIRFIKKDFENNGK